MTGASRGIGRAVAEAFARSGDRVAVHYGTSRAEAEVALAGLAGEGHVLVNGDLASAAGVADVAEQAIAQLGGVDVLVNNAGVAPTPRSAHPVVSTSFEQWQASWRSNVDVNLLGAADLTFLVARHLTERSAGGSIVNIGSRGAFRGEPDHPAYAASNAALHAFGQSMAVALAPFGIGVTSVAPGFVATERQSHKLAGAEGDAIRSQSPFGRVGTPEEIAATVIHLASPEALWASGTIVDLNGASYLRP